MLDHWCYVSATGQDSLVNATSKSHYLNSDNLSIFLTRLSSHTKPGGYVELQAVYPKLLCDDGSSPPENALMAYGELACEASEICGFPLSALDNYKSYLEEAGFVDVIEKRYKMPTSPWPKDRRMKLIGAFELHNLMVGLSGMSLRMFSKAYGWTQEQTELYLEDVKRDANNLNYHTYWEL